MYKITLLSDEYTGSAGMIFLDALKAVIEENKMEAQRLHVLNKSDIQQAISEFDKISMGSKTDLLIIADFACTNMQSAEEEPMYSEMSIPIVHVLFKRPWEYEVPMVWRSDFTTRCYCMLEEDVSYTMQLCSKILNFRKFVPDMWSTTEKNVCCADWSVAAISETVNNLPDYAKTIRSRWQSIKADDKYDDVEAMKKCLQEIGFEHTPGEFQEIMYMMSPIFPEWYIKSNGEPDIKALQLDKEKLLQQLTEFMDLDFKISLLQQNYG